MSRLKDLEKLKRKADDLRQQRDRAQGRLEETEKRLKEEFEVDSLKDAEKLLEKLEKEETVAKEKFDDAMEDFEEKWGDKLEV